MYEKELKIAIEAAREAGELLRIEFHRPGGPRGHVDHADADEIAEWIIRKRLLGVFPSYKYRGEETGSVKSNDPHVWLVDPNDGTAAYLRGARGSAVSIGLVKNGVPVLGVIFAYAAPDDRGDLIAWAEDCEFTRNGEKIETSWDITNPGHAIVLGSTHREDTMRSLLEYLHPYRYRAIPSIAYRLALAAAGEGVLAVSWHHPGDWDYAAGHALIRAAGGIFCDQDGREISYDPDGISKVVYCFGGHPDVVREIQSRDWKAVVPRKIEPVSPFSFARLKQGHAIADADLLSRAQGCLLGQISGDAFGQQVEFWKSAEIRNAYPNKLRVMEDGGAWNLLAGQPTDDSELALMLARSLAREKRYDREQVAQAYDFWLRKSQPFDVGNTTSRAMSGISDTDVRENRVAETMSAHASWESEANGSLMRISPLGIFGHQKSIDDLWQLAASDSALTHPHPICQQACGLFSVAIADAIRGRSAQSLYDGIVDLAIAKEVEKRLLDTLEAAASEQPDYETHSGWVLVAFQNAFFQLLNAPNFEEGMIETVMQGGDTDTNAAIAGALLGAVYGRDAIPFPWRQMVLSCRPDLATGARHPRPLCFWPVDALTLAELLLTTKHEDTKNHKICES